MSDFVKLCMNNYKRLIELVPDLENLRGGCYRKLKAKGYMDLSFEVLTRSGNSMDIAIAHYFKQNGDLVPDPDMRIRVDLTHKAAMPMSFQNALYYREAMDEDGKGNKREAADQASFLSQWLRNLKSQGHTLAETVEG